MNMPISFLPHKKINSPSLPKMGILHGFMGSHVDFIPLALSLQSHYHCLLFDLPGHGEAGLDHPFESLKISLIHEGPFDTLLGYSLGGRLLLHLLPYLSFRKLILISSSLGPFTQEEKERRLLQDQKCKEALLKRPFEEFLRNWYSQPLFLTLSKKAQEEMISHRLLNDPLKLSCVLETFTPARLPYQGEKVASLKKPLLYFYGEQDILYKQEAEKFRALNSKVQIQEIKGTSHALWAEAPLELQHYIKDFHG